MGTAEITPQDFEHLFTQHAGEIHRFLLRRVGHDSENLLSEVFTIAWKRRRDLPSPDSRRAWLFGVARRLVLAEYRRQSRDEVAAIEWSEGEYAPTETRDHQRNVAIRCIVANLPEAEREILTLVTWDGLSVAEAATVSGVRAGTARVRLHRARKRLSEHPVMQTLVAKGPSVGDIVPAGEAIGGDCGRTS